MPYYEIKTDTNSRPSFPEDNTMIIPGNTMIEALSKFKKNRGSMRIAGDVIQCREIYYVQHFDE